MCVASEIFESPDPAGFGPGTGIPEAFLDLPNSIDIDMNSFFVPDEGEALKDGSAIKRMPMDFSGQHQHSPGLWSRTL